VFLKRKWLVIILLVLVIAAAGGGGYYWYKRSHTVVVTQESQVRTTRARSGEMIISITGSGRVIAANEAELGFASDGTITEINVKVGDQVKKGDVLARQEDLSAQQQVLTARQQLLQAQIELETAKQDYEDLVDEATEAERLAAEAAVKKAEEALADLTEGPTAAALAAAQAAVATAKANYEDLGNGPSATDIEQAEMSVAQAKNNLYAAQMSRDAKGTKMDKDSGAYDQAQVSVWNAEISVRQAEINLAELKEPATEAELAEAKATLAQAQESLRELQEEATEGELAEAKATLAQAKEALDELVNGPDEDDKKLAEAKVSQSEIGVEQAEAALAEANQVLTDTVMVASIDGTVITVNGQVGQQALDNETIITLSDLTQPLIEVFVDEEDMSCVAVGMEAEVTLDALPDQTFKGVVTQIDPGLVEESGVQVVRALVQLDATSFNKPQGLPTGLNATVDIIGGHAEDAVLVPVEALREIGTNEDGAKEYGVFVMENGELTFRTVEVGLMDMTYAEIKSGLKVGETVSTGNVETK